MPVTEVASNITSRFNYLYCLDLIVFVCVFVVAGRPDGLAITASALIVGVGALLYRCTVSVKARLAKRKAPRRSADHRFGQRVRRAATVAAPVPAESKSRSWLRDSE